MGRVGHHEASPIPLTDLVVEFPKERKARGCRHLEGYKTCVEITQLASPVCSNPHLFSIELLAHTTQAYSTCSPNSCEVTVLIHNIFLRLRIVAFQIALVAFVMAVPAVSAEGCFGG
jgi:hypothetical protein